MKPTTQCERVEQLLSDAVAKGQPRDLGSEVPRHLAGCEHCRRYEARLRDLMKTLDEDSIPDPGESYWQRFGGRVQQRLESRPVRTWMAWGGLAAAAALVLLLIWLPRPSPGPNPTAEQLVEPAQHSPEDLRCLLNDLLGRQETLDLSGESWDSTDWELTREEQEALLEVLRAEMRSPA